jgi:tetratricopeptide (TPR) repeat protein
VRLSLAEAHRERGDIQAALADLRVVVQATGELAEKKPGDIGVRAVRRSAHRRLGDLLREQGDLAGARASLREALRLAEERSTERPDDLGTRWALADTYAGLGRLERAVALEAKHVPAERREAARASVAWHGKSLEIWARWEADAPSTAFDQGHRAAATRALAEAEAVVSRLETGAAPR